MVGEHRVIEYDASPAYDKSAWTLTKLRMISTCQQSSRSLVCLHHPLIHLSWGRHRGIEHIRISEFKLIELLSGVRCLGLCFPIPLYVHRTTVIRAR